MSRKSISLLLLLIVSPVIIYLLWPSDISRIRRLFKDGAKAVEARKAEDVMSKVSFNYSDEHGLSYMTLKQAVERTFKEMSGVQVEYGIKGIRVKDGKAEAEVDLRVIATYGKDTGYVVGDAARAARLTFSLKKERTKWLVTKVEGLKVEF